MSNFQMKTTRILASIILLTLPAFAEKTKPNILLIAVDDLNDWVGVYGGHPQAKTPNIDRLAKTSMVFRNASCAGPVCGPSRSALLSGFSPATTGAYGNNTNMLESKIVQTHATLPEYFSKHGYTTISCGKIFHKHDTKNGADHGQWAYDVWHDELSRAGTKAESFYNRNKGIIAGKQIENAKHMTGGGSEFSWAVTEKGKEFTQDYRTAKWFKSSYRSNTTNPSSCSPEFQNPTFLGWCHRNTTTCIRSKTSSSRNSGWMTSTTLKEERRAGYSSLSLIFSGCRNTGFIKELSRPTSLRPATRMTALG